MHQLRTNTHTLPCLPPSFHVEGRCSHSCNCAVPCCCCCRHQIVVTSYEISMRDRKYLQPREWLYMIVDEGHRLKNLECRLIRELKALPRCGRTAGRLPQHARLD